MPKPRDDVLAFAKSKCELGIEILFANVVRFSPRDPAGDARGAFAAQVTLLEALSKTERTETVKELRSRWLQLELSLKDLLAEKLAWQGKAPDSVVRKIGEEYDRRGGILRAIELLELDYGITRSDYVPPRGCKGFSP